MPPKITRREQEVIDLLLTGCDNQEIADRLGIKRRTVKAAFNRLFIKFQIWDGVKRVKLAVICYRKELEATQNVGKP